jgi:hypothetical protein
MLGHFMPCEFLLGSVRPCYSRLVQDRPGEKLGQIMSCKVTVD